MLREFKAFVNRGNVLDLAVAVIIGAAFGKIITSLTDSVIMPLIGWLFGNMDFSSYFLRLGPVPETYKGSLTNYAALKEAGVPMIGYGDLATQVVNFLIVAWVIFMVVRGMNMLFRKEQDAPPPPKPPSREEELLAEIRDLLRARA